MMNPGRWKVALRRVSKLTRCLLAFLVISEASHAVTLVRQHQPNAVIVVPTEKPTLAAIELQAYIQKATGAALPIITEDQFYHAHDAECPIFVGSCKNTAEIVDTGAIRPEGFMIRTKDNALYIVGKDATDCGFAVEGTLYGVYEFL